MKPSFPLLACLAAPAALLVTTAAPAAAQPEPAAVVSAESPDPRSSINLSPLSLLLGHVAVTFEHRLDDHHALVAEGGFGGHRVAAAGGWRYHFRGRQHGGFAGAMLAAGNAYGTGFDEDGDLVDADVKIRTVSATANLGYRWMIGDHWNITARIGVGWADYDAEATRDTAEAAAAEMTTLDAVGDLSVGFDGELSVGYAF
jgi:hypothetical protein